MPLPVGITPTTVTMTFAGDDGTPAIGTVSFTPSKATTVDDESDKVRLLPVPVVATLDASGHASVSLVPSDSAAIHPTGWTYDVSVNVTVNGIPFVETFSVDVLSTPSTVDLIDLVPVAPDGPGGTLLVLSVNGKTPNGLGQVTLVPSDIGALATAPVTSVNTKTGAVSLTASDVGAIATGDAVQSVNGHTGTSVTLSASDVGAVPVQSPITIPFSSSIATDASTGRHFRVTLTANATLANPTNPSDGKAVMWELIQDATGGRTLTLDTKFNLGADVPAVVLSTGANKHDFLCAVYIAATDTWNVFTLVRGY